MNAQAAVTEQGPLAIVCGGGSLPLAVVEQVTKRGRAVVLFLVRGAADPGPIERFPHHWMRIGQLGRFFRMTRAQGCCEVVFIGSLVRPSLWQIYPDMKALSLFPRIMAAYRGGDDHLLTGIGNLLEREGLRLVGAHDVAPEILVPQGALGRVQLSERDRADIALGLDYLRTTGRFDVGQAVVVVGNHVLAVEAAEGTDMMLARVAEMRANGRVRTAAGSGVLVKAPKAGQDHRFDLPSIGPQTAAGAARAGLAGIAVAAGATVIAEPEKLIAAADRGKIFVVGVDAGTGR